MIFFGLLLGIVGTDVNTGNLRYDFGIGILFDGINFVPIAMGVFGINEIMANLTNPERRNVFVTAGRGNPSAGILHGIDFMKVSRFLALGGLILVVVAFFWWLAYFQLNRLPTATEPAKLPWSCFISLPENCGAAQIVGATQGGLTYHPGLAWVAIAALMLGGIGWSIWSTSREMGGLMPTRRDVREASGAVARGTALGSLLGILPGGGALLASFAAYSLEKKVARTPERFGHGAIQGVAGPESANNAAAQTASFPCSPSASPPTP